MANYVEAGTVMAGRRRTDPRQALIDLDRMMQTLKIRRVPVDSEQAVAPLEARIRIGRGMGHGGMLNFGDTFAYALARVRNAPLLFVGDDFAKTDVISALPIV